MRMPDIKAKGIDVSYWNGQSLNWAQIKASGIDFAICRAGYGKNNIDSTFKNNVAKASAAGVALGAYWFSYATTVAEAEKEADYLCDAVAATGVKFTYPLCFDYEYDSYDKAAAAGKAPSNELITQMAEAFLARVKKRGYYPANYTNIDYLGKGFSKLTDRYDTWLAQWGTNTPSKDCTLWQYSSTGTISGVSGRFDMNYAYVDYPALIKKCGLNGFDNLNSKEKDAAASSSSQGTQKKTYTTEEIAAAWRQYFVKVAEGYIGYNEYDGSHKKIIDIYNAKTPLPVNYRVSYTDAWCATYVSAMAIVSGLADTIIPRECGCGRFIDLCKNMGIWHENENYVPSPGDLVLYDWQDGSNYASYDNTGGADHIGIVQKVVGNTIYVIEGNYSDSVKVRQISVNGRYLRGFAVPKFGSMKTLPTGYSSSDVESAVNSGSASHTSSNTTSDAKSMIASFQTWLNTNFNAGLIVDGVYGPMTRKAAVKAFQKTMNDIYGAGLVVDGIFGAKSAASLTSNYIKYGSTGSLVRILQGMLYCKSMDPKGFDGIYGNGTKSAVESYQEVNNLTVDGIAGKATFTALFS